MEMPTRYCESCGGALGADDVFCGACGSPVSTKATEPGPPPRPAAAPPPPAPLGKPPVRASSRNPLANGVIAAVVVVAAAGGWWFWRQSQQEAPRPDAPSSVPAPPPQVQAGEDFLGSWYPEDAPGAQEGESLLTFTRDGDHIVGIGTDPAAGRIVLEIGLGPKLHGEAIDGQGVRTPLTAELLSDKQKMILTFAPPASEYFSVVMWRVKEGEGPQPSAAEPTVKPVSEERARELVAALPEVAAYVTRLRTAGKSAIFEVSLEDDQTYRVHVYENVDDGNGMGHTATFGWYLVDRTTGGISPGM